MLNSLPVPGVESAVLRTSIIDCIDSTDGSINIDKFLLHAEEVISQWRWATATLSDFLSSVGDANQSHLVHDPDMPHEIKTLSEESFRPKGD